MERQRWLLEHRAEGTVTASRGEGLLHGEQGRVGGAVAGGPREGRMACALVGPRGGREGREVCARQGQRRFSALCFLSPLRWTSVQRGAHCCCLLDVPHLDCGLGLG